MPESFEQHFPKQPEGPKSPEKIKEEEGLALVREIKEIQKRMEKEGKTIEGYQRITKLAQEIKKLYEGKERDFEAEVKTIVANLEKALKEGVDKNYVARGLAGVGTKEAMELRERLLKEGANKDYVAWSLAGVNTEEAEEFRRKHFADNPTLIAKSYSTGLTVCNGIICRYGYEE